jgi:glycosyltransferase involved in cell wall biosynthesis
LRLSWSGRVPALAESLSRYDEMKVLTIHNKYQHRGGEDEVREAEEQLLQSRGHEVQSLIFDNAGIVGGLGAVRTGLSTAWSQASYRRVAREIASRRPDIVNVHNFFPLASPALHYAAARAGVPVVQTLHNFRLLCPAGTFFRNGIVCEDCVGHRLPIPGVAHGCYHGSFFHTGAVALMLGVHRIMRTWHKKVSLFIAVSEFARQKFLDNGIPESRIVVKPNFVQNVPSAGNGGHDFLYVGRLAEEKGIATMIRAMESTAIPAHLNIVGEGPMRSEVEAAVARGARIRYLGRKPQSEVLDLMAQSKCLIFPSEWYETFGRVAAEAFACGTPVIASRIGAVAEIVDDGRTGFYFRAGDSQDLARVMTEACSLPEKLAGMRIEARREYELKYTAERNYRLTMAAYERAIANPSGS